jgi:hypothetical protein
MPKGKANPDRPYQPLSFPSSLANGLSPLPHHKQNNCASHGSVYMSTNGSRSMSGEGNDDLQGQENEGKEIPFVGRNDTNTTHTQEQKNRHPEFTPEAPVFVG